MLSIRLSRLGSKKRPHYRIVVADSARGRGGNIVESIGTYQPRGAEAKLNLNWERAEYWLSKGAYATNTVRSFLTKKSS